MISYEEWNALKKEPGTSREFCLKAEAESDAEKKSQLYLMAAVKASNAKKFHAAMSYVEQILGSMERNYYWDYVRRDWKKSVENS